jgi:hypothetical protein
MRLFLCVMLCVALALSARTPSTAQDTAATDDCGPLPPRLIVSQEGRVLAGRILNVRPEANTQRERVAAVTPNTMFSVVGGPRCGDGYTWWSVQSHDMRNNQVTGWIAEGTPASTDSAEIEYWTEPRGVRVPLRAYDGSTIYAVRMDDGTQELEGCLAPPDDYTRQPVNGATLNARTLAMLDHAADLYAARGGLVDFRLAVMQGSYNAGGVAASFGTHDGGGAVDLSVRSRVDFSVLTGDIAPMILALREAGFAAWLRDPDVFYAGSPIHIHAIAVGDAELSPAARAQIDGDGGYLRGLDALIADYGGPSADPHGGPVVCQWMIAQGFADMRPTPPPTASPTPTAGASATAEASATAVETTAGSGRGTPFAPRPLATPTAGR